VSSILGAVDIGASLQQALDSLFTFVPRLIGFLVILLIGFIIAKVVKKAVQALIAKVGLDEKTHEGSVGEYVDKVNPNFKPSALIGSIAFWFIFLGVISLAVSQLGIPAVESFVAAIFAYLPNVVAALIIFVVAGAVAAAVGGLVVRTMGDTPTGKIVGTVVPVLVMGIAIFMILTQLKIAPAIVQITYIALLGSVGLALALAFGLGGRDVAASLLSDAQQKGKEQKGQVKQDFQKGKDQAQQDAQAAKEQAQEKSGGKPAASGSRTIAGPGAPRR
jgi:small-conductance mechanosensitive channel